jgi:hypothetical protein
MRSLSRGVTERDRGTQPFATSKRSNGPTRVESSSLRSPEIIRRTTLGFAHLGEAGRPDLMLETLVLDRSKASHHLFTLPTVEMARKRKDEYAASHHGAT